MVEIPNILKHYWGHDSFRDQQEEIIRSVLEKKDTLALLPTGGGKSLCFQIPALAMQGICIVISPLVALMKDQVNSLKSKNIKAVALTSGISFEEMNNILDNCTYGNYKFLYVSPERLQQKIVRERISQMNVNLIAVDEAHCIAQWGHDFRPAYLSIKALRTLHPEVPTIALTATATPKVADEILLQLDAEEARVFKSSFGRSNLVFNVVKTEDKDYRLLHTLKNRNAPAIVYVRSRRRSLELADLLTKSGVSANYYHGGLSPKEKDDRLHSWIEEKALTMVATSAFGMGIDKPNVRTVVHTQLPDSLESYFQEAGRAGRDGSPSEALLLVGNDDETRLKQQFLSVLPTVAFLKKVYRKLNAYWQIGYGEGAGLSFQLNFSDFCSTYELRPFSTYNAMLALDRHSIVDLKQNFKNTTTLKCMVDSFGLQSYLGRNREIQYIVRAILRTYTGIFDMATPIEPKKLADKCGTTPQEVIRALKQVERDQIFEVTFKDSDSEITFLVPREDDKTINSIAKHVERQLQVKKAHIQRVIDYATNETNCKTIQLLNYFGETAKNDCGICSVCTKKDQGRSSKALRRELLGVIQKGPLSSRAIVQLLKDKEADILQTLRMLLEEEKIKINHLNQYELV